MPFISVWLENAAFCVLFEISITAMGNIADYLKRV